MIQDVENIVSAVAINKIVLIIGQIIWVFGLSFFSFGQESLSRHILNVNHIIRTLFIDHRF